MRRSGFRPTSSSARRPAGSAGAGGIVAGGKLADVDDGRNLAEHAGEVELQAEDYDDVTDWKTFGFRYRLRVDTLIAKIVCFVNSMFAGMTWRQR